MLHLDPSQPIDAAAHLSPLWLSVGYFASLGVARLALLFRRK